MFEATTIDAKRNAIARAHAARGAALTDLTRAIFGTPRDRWTPGGKRG